MRNATNSQSGRFANPDRSPHRPARSLRFVRVGISRLVLFVFSIAAGALFVLAFA